MTSNNLPEEVLLLIFNLADNKNEVKIYQHVCRAWYRPAHITFLQNVHLNQFAAVEQFVRSIDCNPNPIYLKAVRNITIANIYDSVAAAYFDKELLKKLFFRFPNLENVSLSRANPVLHSFNDEQCQKFLQICPKNILFDIGSYHDKYKYCIALKKVRLLVTEIDADSMPESSNIADIITLFPRLNSIKGNGNYNHTFKKWLPILQKMSYTKRVSIKSNVQDEDDIAERYLASTTKEEQHQLVEKLSKVEGLNWNTVRVNFSSLKFIEKYLTGLNQLNIRIGSSQGYNQQQRLFCNAVLDLLHSRFNNYELQLNLDNHSDDLSRYIAFIVKQANIRALQLTLTRKVYETAMVLDSNRQDFMDVLAVSLMFPPKNLFSTKDALVNVDEFTLKIQNRHNGIHNLRHVEYCELTLGGFPSIKQATIDIPAFLNDKRSSSRNQKVVCRQLESLILQATPREKFQPFLDKCLYMFPQLKKMHILYHCGEWKEEAGTIQMGLETYSLEKLILDVTPLKMMIKRKIDKYLFTKDDFFVVAVKLSSSKKMHMFKVSFDLSLVIKITGNDLKGLTCGEHYFRVNILMVSLKLLELYMYRYGTPKEEDENYLDVGKYATSIVIG